MPLFRTYPRKVLPECWRLLSGSKSTEGDWPAAKSVSLDCPNAAAEIEAGRLVPLLEDWRMGSAAFFLYYPSRRQVPLALQAFTEFLRENLRAR